MYDDALVGVQDLVDILVGWHIDHEQPWRVTLYVSNALSYFTELWRHNTDTAVTLLSQFIEDIEDYLKVGICFIRVLQAN